MTRPPHGRWTFGTLPGGGGNPARDDPGGLVVKFGGSLLARSDWPDLARDLLAGFAPATPCTFVVGGGAVVDGLRALDAVVRGEDRLVHGLAIDGMGITARYVAGILGLPLVALPLGRSEEVRRGSPPPECGGAILDMAAWLGSAARRQATIPPSWTVTSDTLAAHVAAEHRLGLLLAKSVAPPTVGSLDALAGAGWIDAAFPETARTAAGFSWCAPT